ncbi:nuclear transport factor 2-like isoform X2 [Silene latifolia]|uniref:nuclear transport factor 2-like isoform X2 n=1 Tax=Silene latifolia TaxID=37657 RepID=UPI003D78348C
MAPPYTALEIGAYFIRQYYTVLCDTPEYCHRFYHVSSTMTQVNAHHSQITASTKPDIHELLTSLRVAEVEVTDLNVQKSWKGGLFLTVSGIIRSRNFYGKTKFLQSFFLAPRGNDFFVENDILQFQDQEMANQHPAPELAENVMVDSQVLAYNSHDKQPDSSYESDKTSESFKSLHTQDESLIDKYSLLEDDQQHENNQQHEDLQFETVGEEASVKQAFPLESVVNHLEDPTQWPAIVLGSAHVDELAVKPAAESAAEPASLSYASILQASKGQSSQSVIPCQPSVRQSMPDIIIKEELTSVSVRSLPSSVTYADLEKELKNFGNIKPNGVLIRNNTETGVCFAFVEFEDLSSAHNAIKASPIKLLNQQVYIDEGRASSSTRGGELTSVLVGNLPSHVTNADLEKEFMNFGKIKSNGVTIRNKTETGVCYAFVEFEDMSGVHNAIKASTIKFLGNQVYIEERIVSSSSTSTRGGGGGGAIPRRRRRGKGRKTGRGNNVKR